MFCLTPLSLSCPFASSFKTRVPFLGCGPQPHRVRTFLVRFICKNNFYVKHRFANQAYVDNLSYFSQCNGPPQTPNCDPAIMSSLTFEATAQHNGVLDELNSFVQKPLVGNGRKTLVQIVVPIRVSSVALSTMSVVKTGAFQRRLVSLCRVTRQNYIVD